MAWLRRVVDQRRGGVGADAQAKRRREPAACIEAGTTLLADTTTAGLSWDQIAAAPVRAVVFAEVIGLKRDRGLQTGAAAWKWLRRSAPRPRWPPAPGRA